MKSAIDIMCENEPNKTMIQQTTYPARPINEKYYHITYQDEDTKQARYKMWRDIMNNGEYKGTTYSGDYYIVTYKYNDKYYELAENDEIGIMSYIKEYELEEVA